MGLDYDTNADLVFFYSLSPCSSFQIDLSILDKTLEFPPGSWLLSSYIATGLDSVPVFVKADNSEDVLKQYVESITKKKDKMDE